MIYKIVLIIIGLVLLTHVGILGDDNVRKSITFVPTVAYMNSNTGTPSDYYPYLGHGAITSFVYPLPASYESSFVKALKNKIHLGRFDINDVDNSALQSFKSALGRKVGLNAIKSALEKTIVDKIRKILEINSEIRSGQFVGTGDRQKFIAIKAKELAINSADLEKYMHTAYIAIPCITSLLKETTQKTGYFEFTAGVIWYKVIPEHNEVVYSNYVELSTASATIYFGSNKRKGAAFQKKFTEMAGNIVGEAGIQSRGSSGLSHKSSIIETNGYNIAFNLDRSDDILLDDKYIVSEKVQDAEGNIRVDNIGFARVVRVGINGRPSYGKMVRSSRRPREGMGLTEYRRPSISGNIYLTYMRVEIIAGKFAFQSKEYQVYSNRDDKAVLLIGLRGEKLLSKYNPLFIQSYFYWGILAGSTLKSEPISGPESEGESKADLKIGMELGFIKKFSVGACTFLFESGVAMAGSHRSFKIKNPEDNGVEKVVIELGMLRFYGITGLEYTAGLRTKFRFSYLFNLASSSAILRDALNDKNDLNVDWLEEPRVVTKSGEIRLSLIREI